MDAAQRTHDALCGVCTSLAPNFSSQPEGGRARKKDGANFGKSKNIDFGKALSAKLQDFAWRHVTSTHEAVRRRYLATNLSCHPTCPRTPLLALRGASQVPGAGFE